MFAIISALLGLGPSIASVMGQLAQARVAQAQAQTDKDKIAADERVRSLEMQMEALKEDHAAPYVRLLFAFPFVVYVNKLIIWDKLWTGGHGSTDPLGTDLWAMMMMIAGFYFVHWTIGRFR